MTGSELTSCRSSCFLASIYNILIANEISEALHKTAVDGDPEGEFMSME
jgi:hypothetical protein